MESGKLDYRQEAEVERLLTTANFRRMKDQLLDAEDLCRQALAIAPNEPKAHEMLGEVLSAIGKLEGAVEEFKAAMDLAPGNAAYETKYAKAVLELAERERLKSLALDMLEHPQNYASRKRNPTMAMLCGLVPGFGQLYNGEYIKGAIIFGTLLLFLVVSAALRQPYPKVMTVAEFLQFTHPLVLILGVVSFIAWIYGLVDAPLAAHKASAPKQVGL